MNWDISGLGRPLQGLITPDSFMTFPDPQFIFFAINHAGINHRAALSDLHRMRPRASALPKVIAATLGYAWPPASPMRRACELRLSPLPRPANASVMDFLSPWPWYIPGTGGDRRCSLAALLRAVPDLRSKPQADGSR